MPDASIAFSIFDKILSVAGLIREDRKLERAYKDQVLADIYEALRESSAYSQAISSGESRSPNQERKLAELWHKASIPMRHIDMELADTCFIKSGYWMDPERWNDEQVERHGIKIDQVMRSVRRLLKRT